jgi:hypothetical protein
LPSCLEALAEARWKVVQSRIGRPHEAREVSGRPPAKLKLPPSRSLTVFDGSSFVAHPCAAQAKARLVTSGSCGAVGDRQACNASDCPGLGSCPTKAPLVVCVRMDCWSINCSFVYLLNGQCDCVRVRPTVTCGNERRCNWASTKGLIDRFLPKPECPRTRHQIPHMARAACQCLDTLLVWSGFVFFSLPVVVIPPSGNGGGF